MTDPSKKNARNLLLAGILFALILVFGLPLFIIAARVDESVNQSAQGAEKNTPYTEKSTPDYIAGYIYQDTNQNGQRDLEEIGVKDIWLTIKQTDSNKSQSIQTALFTDQSGYFRLNLLDNPDFYANRAKLNNQQFTIQLSLPSIYKTNNTNPYTLSFLPDQGPKILEFGIYPVKPLNPHSVTQTAM